MAAICHWQWKSLKNIRRENNPPPPKKRIRVVGLVKKDWRLLFFISSWSGESKSSSTWRQHGPCVTLLTLEKFFWLCVDTGTHLKNVVLRCTKASRAQRRRRYGRQLAGLLTLRASAGIRIQKNSVASAQTNFACFVSIVCTDFFNVLCAFFIQSKKNLKNKTKKA